MKTSIRVLLVALVVLFPALAAAADAERLIQVERRSVDDLAGLRAAAVPVVLETSASLFVRGTDGDAAALLARGFKPRVLDASAATADYLQVGLRPDSDRAAIEASGTVLFAEENWMILRVPRGTEPSMLAGMRAFVTRLPRTPVDAPVPQPSLAPERTRLAADPLIQRIVNSVKAADIDAFWTDVTTNPPTGTRYSYSQGCKDAANYCKAKYESFGLTGSLQQYSPSYGPNSIGTQPGAVTPEKVFIVIGHLDDLPSSGTAPGADDNASGSVNVLESAKVLSCWAHKSTIKYITCTGEEQGLVGSDAYAADAKNRGEDIRGVLNMDMIAWAGDGIPNPENLDLDYNAPSQDLALLFAQNATDYGTGLVVDAFLCPSLTASDHASFWSRGWKAVCGITDNEDYCGHGGNYPYYHTSNDTIAHCGDRSLFYGTVKTSVATLATLAEPFKVAFDRPAVACGGAAQLILGDRDLDTDPNTVQTITLMVSSTTEGDPEPVVLTEDGVHSMIFRGTVATTTAPAVHLDGLVSVSATDTLVAHYIDAVDCDGSLQVGYTATAATDCVAPVLTNVHTTSVTDTTATIAWTTDEVSDSVAHWGQSVPPDHTATGTAGTTDHQVGLTGLQSCTVYYHDASSADGAGNRSTLDNGGQYFHFETWGDFGAGLQPCHQGRLTLAKDVLGCTDTVLARLVDMDLNLSNTAIDTAIVHAASTTEETPEVILLTETGPNTSTFTATISVRNAAPVAGNGIVEAGHGDTISVSYRDANDGTGATALSWDSATMDCAPPAVDSVQVTDVADDGATVRVDTPEPTTVRVQWGATEALGSTVDDATLATSHALRVAPLAECGRYYFRVTATDVFQNARTLDVAGKPFAFNAGIIPGIWRDGFETSTGWTLEGEWQIGGPQGKGTSPGDPTVAFAGSTVLGHDLTGLGTYKGDYEPSKTERAISPVINTSGLQKPQLVFRRWLNTGGGGIAYVEVKQGSIWKTVWTSDSVAGVTESAWSLQTISLSPYADGLGSLQVAFKQFSGPGTAAHRAGWNVDRVVLKSANQSAYDACGSCGGAPTFAGIESATDRDACADTGVTLAWKAAPSWGTGHPGTYTIWRDTTPNFTPTVTNRVAAGIAGTTWNDLTAPNGVTLYYLVRAENDETCSSGANNHGATDANTVYASVATTSSRAVPAALSSLAVRRFDDVHVRLAWAAASGAATYRSYRSATPAPGGYAKLGESTALIFDDLGEGATAASWFYLVNGANACGTEGP